ncbi:MAG: hypothetical protein PHU08_01110 [Dehalococcoidales bacterium]|nr:hypothetical protein [Dehalococcoidales bacterium]
MKKNLARNVYFWAAVFIILVTIYLAVATYLRWLGLHTYIGPFFLHHWFTWTGTGFIAVFTPVYYILKRRYPKTVKVLFNIHVFGNLVAVTLISMHFAQQLGRPQLPELGTGILLYPIMVALVTTGFLQRFQIGHNLNKTWRFVHTSVTVSFYLIIIIHVLHGLEII